MKEVYVIFHWNGESYDDWWSGILEQEGAFIKREDAEKRIVELQKDHLFRLNDQDNEENWNLSERASWELKPIKIQ